MKEDRIGNFQSNGSQVTTRKDMRLLMAKIAELEAAIDRCMRAQRSALREIRKSVPGRWLAHNTRDAQ